MNAARRKGDRHVSGLPPHVMSKIGDYLHLILPLALGLVCERSAFKDSAFGDKVLQGVFNVETFLLPCIWVMHATIRAVTA